MTYFPLLMTLFVFNINNIINKFNGIPLMTIVIITITIKSMKGKVATLVISIR